MLLSRCLAPPGHPCASAPPATSTSRAPSGACSSRAPLSMPLTQQPQQHHHHHGSHQPLLLSPSCASGRHQRRRRQHAASATMSDSSAAAGPGQQQEQPLQAQQQQQPEQPEEALKWWQRSDVENMRDLHGGIQQLVDELSMAGDRLVIVEYYAPWCNACRALYPKICRIMGQHLDDVLFLKVNFEENKELARALNVKVLPFFQLYRGAEGKVDQFSCTISKITRLKDAIDAYASPYCSLDEPPLFEEFPSVKPSGSMSSETEADTPTDLRRVSRGDWDWV